MKQVYVCKRCYEPCRLEVEAGMMIDKKFIDLIDDDEILTTCLLYPKEKSKFERTKKLAFRSEL